MLASSEFSTNSGDGTVGAGAGAGATEGTGATGGEADLAIEQKASASSATNMPRVGIKTRRFTANQSTKTPYSVAAERGIPSKPHRVIDDLRTNYIGTKANSTMALIDLDGIRLEMQHLTPVTRSENSDVSLDKPTIVFLHEGLGSIAMWRDWPQTVCDTTGLSGLVYSRRGYGQSDTIPDVRALPNPTRPREGRLPANYLHMQAWEVLPALLAQLGIQRPVLLGHSDGASIALLYAARFPTAACVAMAPHVIVEDISIAAIAQARDAFKLGTLRRSLARYHTDVDCAFWQWNDVWLSEAFRSFDIRQECALITCPMLAIQGWDDTYGSMAQIDFIRNIYSHPALQKLEHCGHSPHRDQPALTTHLIQEFLATSLSHLN